jgi:putative spermidine/putrescine transport system permease protein
VIDRRGSRAAAVLVALLSAAPLAALVVRALADEWRAPALVPQAIGTRGFEVASGGGPAGAALATSLLVACASTIIALALGWPAARVLGERRLRRPGLVFVLLAMPLLVPPYAVGSGLTEWFIRLGLAGTVAGLVLAHLVLVLPYVVVVLLSGFGSRLTELEEMAQTFGAGRAARFAWVTAPSIRPTVAAAALVGFLVSWSQYGSSLAVGAGRPLLPVVLVPFVGTDPQVAATLALLFLAPAVVALVAAARLSRAPL